MTEPTSQHLYVMQNEFGCIKIGRSVNPWERRRNLRQSEHCKVELVAAFEGGGEDEEAIHVELHQYRLEGEWFDGVSDARGAVERIFNLGSDEWKFAHDPEGAARWLDHLRIVRQAKYIYRAVTREIGSLRLATGASWVHDCGIFFCRHLAETGERPGIGVEKRNGEVVNIWYPAGSDEGQVLPAYTSSVAAALLVWPDDLRPATWDGSAIECCIEALIEIRARLPRVERR